MCWMLSESMKDNSDKRLEVRQAGAALSAVLALQEGPGFEPRDQLRPFCVESACSPHAGMGFLRALRFPPTTQRKVEG